MGPLPGVNTSTGEHPALDAMHSALNVKPHCEAPERLSAFLSTLEEARGKRVLIVIKGHPDPDSIATAMAQRHFGTFFDIKSEIVYFDEISHPENRALVKTIDAQLHQYREDMDLSGFDYMSFVDTPTPVLPITMEEIPPVLSLVDHHKTVAGFETLFSDVREDVGATASIYSEYLEHSTLGLRPGNKSDSNLATALMHGIRADTDDFMLAGPTDFRAAAYLRGFLNTDLLRVISKQSITARTMEIIQRGLNNKVIKGTFLFAGVGFVRDEDRDGIAQTADFLLRYEGVETVVVYGIVNGEVVDGSLRTNSPTVDPDAWLKTLFGADGTGQHYGGGRRNKGGFRIPLGLFARCQDRDALWAIGKKTIEDLFFEKIGVEKEKVASS